MLECRRAADIASEEVPNVSVAFAHIAEQQSLRKDPYDMRCEDRSLFMKIRQIQSITQVSTCGSIAEEVSLEPLHPETHPVRRVSELPFRGLDPCVIIRDL